MARVSQSEITIINVSDGDTVTGPRGPGFWRYDAGSSDLSAVDTTAEVNVFWYAMQNPDIDPVKDDRFIIATTHSSGTKAFIYNGTNWTAQAAFIDGNLLVNGTITSNKVATNFIDAFSLNADNITTGSLNADYIQIDGAVLDTVNGNLVLRQNGVVRNFILDGAVSDGGYMTFSGTYANGAVSPSLSMGVPLTNSQFFNIGARVVYRGYSATATYISKTGEYNNYVTGCRAILQMRTKTGTTWSSWSNLNVFPWVYTTYYQEFFYSLPYIDEKTDMELRVYSNVGGGQSTSSPIPGPVYTGNNFGSSSIVARAVVR